MKRIEIPIEKLNLHPFEAWNDWFLLTAGEYKPDGFNPMTVSWGSMGIMWGKPFVQVVVRPQRFTYEFIEKYDTFTVCAFPKEYKQVLGLLGSKSGRDIDKITESGLIPIPSAKVDAPGFEQAELIIECKKLYYHDYNPEHFLWNEMHDMYKAKDYHRSYFGEILAIYGTEKYILTID